MKDIKVGERLTITIEVVKAKGCSGCFFNNDRCVSGIPVADEYHKQFAKPNMPTHWMKMPTHP